MIKVSYDNEHNTVVIEFFGKVDQGQGERYLPDIEKVLPQTKKGFKLLVDLSLVQSIDPKIKGSIAKAMDLFNAQGVAEVIRVIPHHAQDIGLNIMSIFHYSEAVKNLTLQSREEAEERLSNESARLKDTPSRANF